MSKTEKTLIPMDEATENIPLKKLTGKQALFLRHLLDESNPDTFMNATGSAKAAKYNCSTENSYSLIGYENIRKLKPYISQWLDEVGLSEERLRLKIVELLEVDNYPVQRAAAAWWVGCWPIAKAPTWPSNSLKRRSTNKALHRIS